MTYTQSNSLKQQKCGAQKHKKAPIIQPFFAMSAYLFEKCLLIMANLDV
jgi:hypothetical protein